VVWFTRDWSQETDSFTFGPRNSTVFTRDSLLEQRTLPNVLHLSKLVAENNQQVAPVFQWFKDKLHFFALGADNFISGGFTTKQFAEKTVYTDDILKLLRSADIGVTSASVMEEEKNIPVSDQSQSPEGGTQYSFQRRKIFKVELSHKGKGEDSRLLGWSSESLGTRRLYALAGPWLDILQKGRIACMDELETSMHPLMVRELLRLFFNEKTNPDHAQILFTTHNPILLDPMLIRRDQIWFTDKDNEGATHLYPLTDYEPRQGESLVRGYMSGRYGAIPFIPSGLLGETTDTGDSDSEPQEDV
jgi:AAA15 family ATPase/GTPase